MANVNNLKKLKRRELLEMMIDLSEENELLQSEVDNLQVRGGNGNSNNISLGDADSIAEAAKKINEVIETAQKAADQYLENMRMMTSDEFFSQEGALYYNARRQYENSNTEGSVKSDDECRSYAPAIDFNVLRQHENVEQEGDPVLAAENEEKAEIIDISSAAIAKSDESSKATKSKAAKTNVAKTNTVSTLEKIKRKLLAGVHHNNASTANKYNDAVNGKLHDLRRRAKARNMEFINPESYITEQRSMARTIINGLCMRQYDEHHACWKNIKNGFSCEKSRNKNGRMNENVAEMNRTKKSQSKNGKNVNSKVAARQIKPLVIPSTSKRVIMEAPARAVAEK